MTKEEKIKKVKEFRRLLKQLQDGKATEKTREKISQLIPVVSLLMEELKTLKTMTLGAPPMFGGQQILINPIENIFQVPYGLSYEVRNALIDMLNKTIGVLQSKEEISKSVKDNIWSIMHPEIIRVAQQRFESEQYADAVEAAFKEINLQVKTKCKDRHQNKDGKGLMMMAFSANNPVLKFAPSSSFSEYDIQEGYMHMFAGAMQGIRNPKAHANEMITKEDALRKLAFASMLMYKLDTVVE
ncbi:MAG: TIGR02391 family protein [Paludibacteraceae bacterium]|nr:TIGR02391 family protein [Paludibacteraceae bacterium]